MATSNGGTSWSTETTGYAKSLRAIQCLAHASTTDCWALGETSTLLSSIDGGATWSIGAAGTTQLNALSFANSGRGWAAGNAGAMYALSAPCSAGTLSIGTPATIAFPALSLSGLNQTDTASVGLTVEDETATGFGWNVSATSTTFTSGAGKTLPTTATTVTGASSVAAAGNCTVPVNSVAYPLTLPAAATAPAAVKLFDAGVASGTGPVSVNLNTSLAVPASASSGSYSSTWTFTIASGP
jgi:hypothetical protein